MWPTINTSAITQIIYQNMPEGDLIKFGLSHIRFFTVLKK